MLECRFGSLELTLYQAPNIICILYNRFYKGCSHLAGSQWLCPLTTEDVPQACAEMAVGSRVVVEDRCFQCSYGNKRWYQVMESHLVKISLMPSDFERIGSVRRLNGQWWNIYRVSGYVFGHGITRDINGRLVFGFGDVHSGRARSV